MEYIFGALVVLVIFTSTVYSQSNGNTSSVQLLVNYESLCPDSINFFNNHLNQAVKQFGSQLEVKLIPWGIANVINIVNKSNLYLKCLIKFISQVYLGFNE